MYGISLRLEGILYLLNEERKIIFLHYTVQIFWMPAKILRCKWVFHCRLFCLKCIKLPCIKFKIRTKTMCRFKERTGWVDRLQEEINKMKVKIPLSFNSSVICLWNAYAKIIQSGFKNNFYCTFAFKEKARWRRGCRGGFTCVRVPTS